MDLQKDDAAHAGEGADPSLLRSGTVVDGKYKIIGRVGQGGMGTVYRAEHLQLSKSVAIKVMHAGLQADSDSIARFRQEAHIISELQHKHILSVFSCGQWNRSVFTAMELIDGKSLKHYIYDATVPAPVELLPLLLQVCDAMSFAHKNGVLHRDLKPDNILVVEEPDGSTSAKVVDFGLAKLIGSAEAQRLTRTGEVVGDPHYMSPEQCRGQTLNERSDIYSFGCLMYEMFSRRLPFVGETATSVLFKHVSDEVPPFTETENVPPAIEAIIFKSMEKEPQKRFGSFDEVATELREFVSNPSLSVKRRPRKKELTHAVFFRICMVALFAAPVAVVIFLLSHRNTPETSDPYVHMSQQELRTRARSLEQKAYDFTEDHHDLEQSAALLVELEQLRKYLVNDPFTEGLIDYQHGLRSSAVFGKNKQRLDLARQNHESDEVIRAKQQAMEDSLKETKAYLRKAVDEFAAARKLVVASAGNGSAVQPASLHLDEIQSEQVASLAQLRLMTEIVGDGQERADISQEILDLMEHAPAPIEKGRSAQTQASFDILIKHRLANQQFEEAGELADRKLAFLTRLGCSPDLLSRESAKLASTISGAKNATKQKHHPN